MIQQTTDYDMFVIIDENRRIHQKNLKKLIKSIEENNLLEYRPILVDEEFRVIDGQHRLKAASILGKPIFYTICKDLKVNHMVELNSNQLKWSLEDYINYYARTGNRNYIDLLTFMEKYNLATTQAVMFCRKNNDKFVNSIKLGSWDLTLIRRGEFQFPQKEALEGKLQYLRDCQSFIDFIREIKIGDKQFLGTARFNNALFYFLRDPQVDREKFKKRLSLKVELLRMQSSIPDYLHLMTTIYNHGERNPIKFYE